MAFINGIKKFAKDLDPFAENKKVSHPLIHAHEVFHFYCTKPSSLHL